VIPDQPQKRRDYEEQVVERHFTYIKHGPDRRLFKPEIVNRGIRQLPGITRLQPLNSQELHHHLLPYAGPNCAGDEVDRDIDTGHA